MVARLKLKGIDGRAPPGVEPAASFDSARETHQAQTYAGLTDYQFFLILWVLVHYYVGGPVGCGDYCVQV